MRTKVCKNCKEEKIITEFYANGYTPAGTKKYKPNCKPCESILVLTKHRENIKKALNAQDRKYECEVCSYNKNYAAITFHHYTTEKNFEIANAKSRSYESLFHEISICSVLCSNCHAEVHNPQHMVDEV